MMGLSTLKVITTLQHGVAKPFFVFHMSYYHGRPSASILETSYGRCPQDADGQTTFKRALPTNTGQQACVPYAVMTNKDHHPIYPL
jgi:hypothetical protein